MLWKALRFQRLDLERGSARFSIIKGMTVLDVLESTTAYFNKREIDRPRLNAEHLLAQVLRCKRIELYLEFERDLGEAEFFFFKQKTAYEIGLGIPAEPLFRSMSSLMLLLVWLIFFMVLIKLLPILGTISGKTVKLMVLALICLGNNRQD